MILAVAAGMQPNLTGTGRTRSNHYRVHHAGRARRPPPQPCIGHQTIFAAGLTLMLLTLFYNVSATC
jgi:phosphate transport system permease protein